ncbi:restriction endonuclease subunit S [Bosea sp. CCNWLW174]|uniref:restriction endonuclease subunit S n=1 Tax=unclassified Bosea (in: a-proteobacteria) TaxID=2653178 RepID=UPI00301426D1
MPETALPIHWTLKPLGALCNLTNGFAFKPSDWSSEGTPIIRIQNLNGGKEFNFFKGSFVPEKYIVANGSLLFSWSGNRGTSFGPFIWKGLDGYVNQHIFKVESVGSTNVRWLYYALDRVRIMAERDAHGGSGLVHVKRSDFVKYLVECPPPCQQELIADILDAIDDAILEADALIEKLRTVHVGMIDDLLMRGLADDRSPRVPSALVETAVGPRPAKWKIANLGRFVVGAEYGTNLSLGDSSAGIPVLRMNNIQDGEFDLSDLKYAPAHAVERFRVQRDDVLFNRTNSWEHVGKAAIWRQDEPGPAFASYLVRLHCGDELLPEFLHLWLNWAPVQRAIRQFATPGVQQVNINPTNLRRALIAVPDTLDEQRAIIARVNGVSTAIEDHCRERAKLASLREGLRDDLLTGRQQVVAIREAAE